jgi:hypothetical protein
MLASGTTLVGPYAMATVGGKRELVTVEETV